MADIVIEELGYIELEIAGVNQRIDVCEVHNRLRDLHQAQAGSNDTAYNAAIVDLLAELGYPRVSQYVAVRFVQVINEQVERLKHGPFENSPELQDSTTLTPGN